MSSNHFVDIFNQIVFAHKEGTWEEEKHLTEEEELCLEQEEALFLKQEVELCLKEEDLALKTNTCLKVKN
jgi:hypothetical protein